MQVVILCGGQGTRIRDVADDIPKPMIPIGGKPIVWHIMKRYARYGFTNFVLCLGYKSWVIKRFFLDYHPLSADLSISLETGEVTVHNRARDRWKVHLVDTGLQTITGGRIKRLAAWLGNETFMLTYGDAVADIDIDRSICNGRSIPGTLQSFGGIFRRESIGIACCRGHRMLPRGQSRGASKIRFSWAFHSRNRSAAGPKITAVTKALFD